MSSLKEAAGEGRLGNETQVGRCNLLLLVRLARALLESKKKRDWGREGNGMLGERVRELRAMKTSKKLCSSGR